MKRFGRISLYAGMWAVAAANVCWSADVVLRKSSKARLQGEIVEMSRSEISVKPRLKSRPVENIPVNDIEQVRWDNEPASLNLSRTYERSGRFQEALEGYNKSFKTARGANLQTDLKFLIARATAELALADSSPTDSSALDAAIARLEDFRKAHSRSFRYYETLSLLGRAYLAQGDFDKAHIVFMQVGEAPWPEYKVAAQISEAQLLLKKGDAAAALAAFDAVLAAPDEGQPAQTAPRHRAMLGKAMCLQRQHQHEAAIALLQTLVDQAPADAAAIQAEASLRKGDSLRAINKNMEAVLAYLYVDLLFSGDKSLHAESLYRLAALWEKVGHPRRAADASQQLLADYPDSRWARQIAAGDE